MNRFAASIIVLFLLSFSGWAQSSGKWLSGTWRGQGRQTDDNSTWSMEMTAHGKKFRIKYPSLKCGGEWRLISLSSQRAKFRERIRYGVRNCEPRGTVIIKKLKKSRIEYSYFYPRSKRMGAYAVLRRSRL